jgi:hypothetical protein
MTGPPVWNLCDGLVTFSLKTSRTSKHQESLGRIGAFIGLMLGLNEEKEEGICYGREYEIHVFLSYLLFAINKDRHLSHIVTYVCSNRWITSYNCRLIHLVLLLACFTSLRAKCRAMRSPCWRFAPYNF